MDRLLIAAGAAVGSTIAGYQGTMIGAGTVAIGLAALEVGTWVALIGGGAYRLVEGVVGVVGRGDEATAGQEVPATNLLEGAEERSLTDSWKPSEDIRGSGRSRGGCRGGLIRSWPCSSQRKPAKNLLLLAPSRALN